MNSHEERNADNTTRPSEAAAWRAVDAGVAAGYGAPDAAGWQEHLVVVRRHKWIVLACCGLGWLWGYWKSGKLIPEYEATAVIRVGQATRMPSDIPFLGSLGGGVDLLTELELLRSRRMARIIVDSLDLTVQAIPAVKDALADASLVGGAASHSLNLWFGPDAYAAVDPDGKELARAAYGRPLLLPFARLTLLRRPEGIATAQVNILDPGAAVAQVRGGLETRVRGGTQIVDLSFTDRNPWQAAAIVNMVARVYQHSSQEDARRRARALRSLLVGQLAGAEEAQAAAQKELDDFQRKSGILPSTQRLGQLHERVLEVEGQHLRLKSDREILVSMLASFEEKPATDAELQALVYAPVVSDNAMVQSLYGRYLDLKSDRATLVAGRYGAAEISPEVERLDQMAAATKEELLQAARNLVGILDRRIAAAAQALAQVDQRVGDLPEGAARETELIRKVRATEQVLDELNRELLRTQMTELTELGSVDIVDFAQVPTSPIGGRRRLPKTMLGLLLGALAGLLAAFGANRMDTTIKEREEVESVLRVPGLAAIPRPAGWRNGRAARLLARMRGSHPEQVLLVARPARELMPLLEAYRVLRTNLMFSGLVSELKVIVVTSPVPGDGKTTVATNLAIMFAQQGARTLLVDANLRRPQLHRYFRVDRVPGLTDILIAREGIDSALRSTETSNLYVLPAGRPAFNPPEILGSERLKQVVQLARPRFDVVIFDTPPVLPFTDAAVLGAVADGVVLVVSSGSTDRKAAMAAVVQLRSVGARIVGCVVNRLDTVRRTGHYDASVYTRYVSRDGQQELDKQEESGREPLPWSNASAPNT